MILKFHYLLISGQYGDQLGSVLKNIVTRSDDCIDDILISAVSILDTIIDVYFDGEVFKKLLHFLNIVLQEGGMLLLWLFQIEYFTLAIKSLVTFTSSYSFKNRC